MMTYVVLSLLVVIALVVIQECFWAWIEHRNRRDY